VKYKKIKRKRASRFKMNKFKGNLFNLRILKFNLNNNKFSLRFLSS
jgi:hypothetical protein